jgi:hypothetical protein
MSAPGKGQRVRLFERDRNVLSRRPATEQSNIARAMAAATGYAAAERAGNGHEPVVRPAVVRPPQSTPNPADEAAAARRFGELLVADKIITQHQLDTALQMQTVAREYVPLGQVLLANNVITRKRLNQLLQRYGKRSRLGAILVKGGHITSAQLEEALAHQRRVRMPLGQALITLGHIDETTMRDALCTQLHVNFFDVDNIVIDQKLANLISERFATRHLVVPLFCIGKLLVVAMDDPSQVALIETLEAYLGLQVEVVTTTTAKLMAAIRRLYGPPQPPEINPSARRNILVGPVRDFVVAELAARSLHSVIAVPF